MSSPVRIALAGATGLVGRRVMEVAVGRPELRLVAIGRSEAKLPAGARMEQFVAAPSFWGEIMEAVRPHVFLCALGTTWKKSGQEETAFRAADYDLVMESARQAIESDVRRMVFVSSVGAHIGSKQLYLRVKGEVERDLARMGFDRLDIMRPGLLRGERHEDSRPAERAGQVLAPLADLMLHGKYRIYRSVDARIIARAMLALALKSTRGRYIHEHDSILRAARDLPGLGG
ncbi:MAG: NAD(P)H-binding protein [Sphingomonadaceae bacterium]